jgi:hypothetical protein
MDLFLTICLSVLAFATGLVQYLFNRYNKGKDEKDKRDSSLSLIIIGGLVLCVACWKGIRENNSKDNIKVTNRALQNTLVKLDTTSDALSNKLITIDTLSNYIKRVDRLGIKRDTVTNMPIVTKTINSNIKSQINVTSNNQKGGITAGSVTNNH